MTDDKSAREPGGPPVAEVIDAVDWDYDPESQNLSPLVSTQRYFRDFPWEPEDLPDGPVEGDRSVAPGHEEAER